MPGISSKQSERKQLVKVISADPPLADGIQYTVLEEPARGQQKPISVKLSNGQNEVIIPIGEVHKNFTVESIQLVVNGEMVQHQLFLNPMPNPISNKEKIPAMRSFVAVGNPS